MSPVDATPIFKMALDLAENGTKQDKEDFTEILEDAFQEAGVTAVNRALDEKLMTIEEWEDMHKKYGVTGKDIMPILSAFFIKQDGHTKKKERIIITTTPDSLIYKHRDFFEKRFGVIIRDMIEVMEMMLKDKDIRKKMPKAEYDDAVKELKRLQEMKANDKIREQPKRDECPDN